MLRMRVCELVQVRGRHWAKKNRPKNVKKAKFSSWILTSIVNPLSVCHSIFLFSLVYRLRYVGVCCGELGQGQFLSFVWKLENCDSGAGAGVSWHRRSPPSLSECSAAHSAWTRNKEAEWRWSIPPADVLTIMLNEKWHLGGD